MTPITPKTTPETGTPTSPVHEGQEPRARADGSRSLGQDWQALLWLVGSPQLDEPARTLIEEALLGWSLAGLELPGQLHPQRVPAGGHLAELAAVTRRWSGHTRSAAGVAAIMQLGRTGVLLDLAVRAATDPAGVRAVLAERNRLEPPELPQWALDAVPALAAGPG